MLRESYVDPIGMISTNVMGNMVEAVRKHRDEWRVGYTYSTGQTQMHAPHLAPGDPLPGTAASSVRGLTIGQIRAYSGL